MIRPAELKDFDRLADVYATARGYMRENGNAGQWGDSYPPGELIRSDIQKGRLYVLEEDGMVHAAFAFILGDDPTYARIEGGRWPNNLPYGAIHRVASDGTQNGVFQKCVAFCKGKSDQLRIDTHADNKTMQHVIEKNGFERCGIIYFDDGSPRIAYQWSAPDTTARR